MSARLLYVRYMDDTSGEGRLRAAVNEHPGALPGQRAFGIRCNDVGPPGPKRPGDAVLPPGRQPRALARTRAPTSATPRGRRSQQHRIFAALATQLPRPLTPACGGSMSVGFVTHRAWLWFDGRQACRPSRRESRYSSNEGHVSNSGRNCMAMPEAKAGARA